MSGQDSSVIMPYGSLAITESLGTTISDDNTVNLELEGIMCTNTTFLWHICALHIQDMKTKLIPAYNGRYCVKVQKHRRLVKCVCERLKWINLSSTRTEQGDTNDILLLLVIVYIKHMQTSWCWYCTAE